MVRDRDGSMAMAEGNGRTQRPGNGRAWFWGSLVLAIGYGLQGLMGAFSRPYVIQDDARQHVFWMERFVDLQLFPNDAIADYFQMVAPPLYQGIYASLATLGIDPLLAAKFLPIALGVGASAYAYRLTVALLPIPAAGFLGALFANQALWLEDDLISATPRAFAELLLLMAADALARNRLGQCWAAIALQGGIYPQAMMLSFGAVALGRVRWHWRPTRWRWRHDRQGWIRWWGCVAIAVAALIALTNTSGAAIHAAGFGPALTAAEARQLPEFSYVLGEPGRSHFFDPNPILFWLVNPRSGLLFPGVFNPLALAALALPWLLRDRREVATAAALPSDQPMVCRISPHIHILGDFLGTSILLWSLAHLLLFRLHLPGRYPHYTLILVLIPSGAIALFILGDRLWRWWRAPHRSHRTRMVTATLAIGLLLPLAIVPALPSMTIPSHLQIRGRLGPIYEFLQTQPKDILIASLSKEASNIPAFAHRSVLTGQEFAIPYHRGYAALMRRRIEDTIAAHYTADPAALRAYLNRYDIDYLIVEPWTLTAEQLADDAWLHHYPNATGPALDALRAGQIPALFAHILPCNILEADDRYLVDAHCIRNGRPPQQT